MPFAPIDKAVEAFGRGEIVVVVDDADRENEGDLIMAAEYATPEKIAFFLNHTSGVICMPMLGPRLDELELPPMVAANTESNRTAFTVSVDARHVTTTGISAADRAATIAALIDPATGPVDLARPGHIFPLRYREGGVLKRGGHTEAAVDLARMAGLYPAGVLCEVVTEDKTRWPGCPSSRSSPPPRPARSSPSPTSSATGASRRSWSSGWPRPRSPPSGATSPATPTSPCSTATSTWPSSGARCRASRTCSSGSTPSASPATCSARMRCDCGLQLQGALERIAEAGIGVVLYLRGHEGRGIGLAHKLRAYALQDEGRRHRRRQPSPGLPVDSREYGIGAQILVDLGITTMRLLTNNPAKYGGLEGFGLDIVERVPLQSVPTAQNLQYLRTKQQRLGHLLEGLEE